jgi:hypothetical protein
MYPVSDLTTSLPSITLPSLSLVNALSDPRELLAASVTAPAVVELPFRRKNILGQLGRERILVTEPVDVLPKEAMSSVELVRAFALGRLFPAALVTSPAVVALFVFVKLPNRFFILEIGEGLGELLLLLLELSE